MKSHLIEFPEPVYSINSGYTPDFNSTKFRYIYTSLNRPTTTYDYDMINGTNIKVKEQVIPSGFIPENYTVERLWAQAKDGKKIPLSIVYKNGLVKNQQYPTLLYAYDLMVIQVKHILIRIFLVWLIGDLFMQLRISEAEVNWVKTGMKMEECFIR